MTPGQNILAPKPGRVLLSEPFLKDPNFARSVVLLLNHEEEQGTFGLVLNHSTELTLNHILEREDLPNIRVFEGGPVELNTLHFIHKIPEISEEGISINDQFWWGGNFEYILSYLAQNPDSKNDIRFFLGYSGWAPGQLMDERMEQAWWICDASNDQIFTQLEGNNLWKSFIKGLGPGFDVASESPMDPQWN
jgi:putative transcriptional regulator